MADVDEAYDRVLEHLHVVDAEILYLWKSIDPAQLVEHDRRIRLAQALLEACQ
jgi:hypothetical protein